MHGLALLLLTTVVPWLEYRAAVPLMVKLGVDPWLGLPLIIAINAVVPSAALLAAAKLEHFLLKLPLVSNVLRAAWRLTFRGREKFEKYGYPALALLVFIPLPGSGMWSAVAVSYLLRLDPLKSIAYSVLGLVPSALLVYYLVSFFT